MTTTRIPTPEQVEAACRISAACASRVWETDVDEEEKRIWRPQVRAYLGIMMNLEELKAL